jgi:hypothetical protein
MPVKFEEKQAKFKKTADEYSVDYGTHKFQKCFFRHYRCV